MQVLIIECSEFELATKKNMEQKYYILFKM